MSKTRNGRSSSTKKSKVAKVATKKLLGRGKNKRKTAKLGKVQCGGISLFPGRVPVDSQTRKGLYKVLGNRGRSMKHSLNRAGRNIKRRFSKKGSERQKSIRNASKTHEGNISQIQSKYQERINSNARKLQWLDGRKSDDIRFKNYEIQQFEALMNKNKEQIELYKNLIADLEKKTNGDVEGDVEETKQTIQEIQETHGLIKKLESENLKYSEKKNKKETEREKIQEEYDKEKIGKETSDKLAKKAYQLDKETSEVRKKKEYLNDLAKETIAPKFRNQIEQELDKIKRGHEKIRNILDKNIKKYDNIVDLKDLRDREVVVEMVQKSVKDSTQELYEPLYNKFIKYLNGETTLGEEGETTEGETTVGKETKEGQQEEEEGKEEEGEEEGEEGEEENPSPTISSSLHPKAHNLGLFGHSYTQSLNWNNLPKATPVKQQIPQIAKQLQVPSSKQEDLLNKIQEKAENTGVNDQENNGKVIISSTANPLRAAATAAAAG